MRPDSLSSRGDAGGQDRDRDRSLEWHRRRDHSCAARRGRPRRGRGEARRPGRRRRGARARRHRSSVRRALRRGCGRRARRRGHPRQQRWPGARPRPLRRLDRSRRGGRAGNQRARIDPHDPARPPAAPGRRPHRQHGLGRGQGRLSERLALRDVEVRRARVHAGAARGPARPADPDHERRAGSRRDGLLAGPLPRRRVEGERRLRRRRARRAGPAGGRRGMCRLRAHAAAERERRRARRDRPRSVQRRPHPARGVTCGVAMTILEGSTFCICDEIGDLGDETSGFFAEDTRFLSRLELSVNGERPLLLSSGKVEYFSAAFYMRNPVVDGLLQDTLSIVRERFVGRGMQDHLIVRNESNEELALELVLEVGTDFADIISVKEHDFALGDPLHARPLPPQATIRYDPGGNQLVLEEATSGGAKTEVLLSKRGEPADSGMRFRLQLGPREEWDLRLDVVASLDGEETEPLAVERQFGEERAHVQESLSIWNLRVPRLRTRRDDLQLSFRQSVADLAALRMRDGDLVVEHLPAAGMPWFMTVFGRDTLITGLQTMLLGPELAIASLGALTALQAKEDDASIDAEPGKIVHELRRGRAAQTWFGRYYGTVDATPLFLVLLGEVWRWTADAELAERYREPALAALEWIDRHGDADGDGFVEYQRRTDEGLVQQGWKDSHDSVFHADGTLAQAPIALCEVQGYVYEARLAVSALARTLGQGELAAAQESQARQLRERFDEAFWCEEIGTYAI